MLPGEVIPLNTPASLPAALSNSVASPIFCVVMTCGRFEPFWAQVVPAQPLYYLNQEDEVIDVKVNGVSLDLVADQATCLAQPGSWFWADKIIFSSITSKIYIHLNNDTDPNERGQVVETFLRYRFSDGATDAGGYWWEPRLLDLPALKIQNPIDFKGLVQTGGGMLTLLNEDQFFKTRMKQNWDAGTTTIIMGAAGLAWANFVTLAVFTNFQPSSNDKNFMLEVKEPKIKLDKPYPPFIYDIYTYPNIRQGDIGKTLQRAYGEKKSVNPVCIDTTNLQFQLAGHQIKSFDGVRVKDLATEEWVTKNFLTTDVATARFTMDPADWTKDQAIAVDFTGLPRIDETVMDNPAEIISDILQDMGEAVNAADFEAARLWYDAGYIDNNGDTSLRISMARPAIYLDNQSSALTVINTILKNCRAYLTTNPDGSYSMRPFRIYQGKDLEMIYDEDMIGGLRRVPQISPVTNKISMVTVNYGFRDQEGWHQNVTYEIPANQFTRDQKDAVPYVFDSLLYGDDDAAHLAQALANEYIVDPLQYTTRLKWKPFTWKVGDSVSIVSTIHGLDVLAEIVGMNINIKDRGVDLILGNLRGFDEATGFWVLSTDLCPDGSSLAWLPGDPEQQYRRHNAGHWHNAKDQASNSPLGAEDCAVSRWF